jgi:hypothetical protein
VENLVTDLSANGFDQPWKAALVAKWEEIGAEACLARVGMDYERDFVQAVRNCESAADPYADFEWSVFQFPRLVSGVLHAAPKSINNEPVTWEEWYFEDGAAHHNVLRNHPHPAEEKTVTLNDDEHPQVVMNIEWHYLDDEDHRPLYLR